MMFPIHVSRQLYLNVAAWKSGIVSIYVTAVGESRVGPSGYILTIIETYIGY